MAKHLQRDLDNLQRDLLALAGAGRRRRSTRRSAPCRSATSDLAREVIAGDTQIDEEENHVEEECLKILALHQPVAVDLRRIAAAHDDQHRSGAHGRPGRGHRRARPAPGPAAAACRCPTKLQRMTDLTTMMVRQSLDAFVNLDTRAGPRVSAAWTTRSIATTTRSSTRLIDDDEGVARQLIEPGLSLFSAMRHLERIADHATNIAEDVVYLVEGEIVRHRPRRRVRPRDYARGREDAVSLAKRRARLTGDADDPARWRSSRMTAAPPQATRPPWPDRASSSSKTNAA